MTQLNLNTSIGRFIENKKGKTESITYENYLHELKLFVEFMNESLYETGQFTERVNISNFDKFLDKLNIRLVNDYKFYLLGNNLEKSTISKKLVVVKNFISFLYRNEYITKDFAKDIDNVKVPQKEVIALEVEEVDLVLGTLGNFKDREALRDELIMKMILVHGFRSFEIRNLKISNIDFTTGEATFKAKRDADGETTTIILHPKFLPMIQKYISVNRKEGKKGYEDILFTSRVGTALSTQGVIDIVKKRLTMCGLPKETVDVITTHKLRSSFVTYLAHTNDGTLTTFDIQRLARHESASTTSRYVKVSEERKSQITNNVFGSKI